MCLAVVTVPCPVCNRELHLPIYASKPDLREACETAVHSERAIVHMYPDSEYIRAHWATHP